jgi:hypothetical protein
VNKERRLNAVASCCAHAGIEVAGTAASSFHRDEGRRP